MTILQQLPTPRHMHPELEQILLAQGGLFLLEGEHDASTLSLFSSIVSRFIRHVEYAHVSLYEKSPRPVEFGFISATDLNAFAYATPIGAAVPFDFIGINVGVPFTLANLFNRMLAHPDIFSYVGDPTKENHSIHQLENLITDVMRSRHEFVAPVCNIRSIFAYELAQLALDFLFFHELTHLRNGHLEFVRSNLALNHWSEAFGNASATDSNMVLQTLEMDADCGAILLLLNSVRSQISRRLG
jgi:hypothetical protein